MGGSGAPPILSRFAFLAGCAEVLTDGGLPAIVRDLVTDAQLEVAGFTAGVVDSGGAHEERDRRDANEEKRTIHHGDAGPPGWGVAVPSGPRLFGASLLAIEGGLGADVISGEGGADSVSGNIGPDIIDGGGGNDSLFGNGAADTLTGGTGDDFLRGGNISDTYLFDVGFGQDIVSDNGWANESGADAIEFGVGIDPADLIEISNDVLAELNFVLGNDFDL